MARGAEACAAMVAEQISGWLKQQFQPSRHADISRSDLSQSLCSDARRAEEGADGTVAYKAADASRKGGKARMDRGTYSIWSLSVSDRRGEDRAVPGIGKEISLPEQATRTS